MTTLAILGCGNMGEAILHGLWTLGPGERPANKVLAVDPAVDKLQRLTQDLPGLQTLESPVEAIREADVVLLAVKPQQMASLLDEVAGAADGKLIVSIAAGLPTSFFERRLPGARVVRTMPNTPVLVGKGAVGLCRGTSASADDLALASSLFVGCETVEVDESQMDAVTALSGSGPAYFFAMVEAMTDAGVAAGLSRDVAEKLAVRTFAGAAALLESSPDDAASLRRRVTSPGGTTEAALNVLSQHGHADLIKNALLAAARRGKELAEAVK